MMDVVEEYLYSYTYPASSITLTSIPIYYLTPNTLIYVHDDNTGIVTAIDNENQTVTVNVDMFGRDTPTEVSFTDIRKI